MVQRVRDGADQEDEAGGVTAGTGRRKRSSLVEGLAAGVERADVAGMAATLGDGLVRITDAWLQKGRFPVPQMCPITGCKSGPYSSKQAVKNHFQAAHAGMSGRDRSWFANETYLASVRQAMNGTPRSP